MTSVNHDTCEIADRRTLSAAVKVPLLTMTDVADGTRPLPDSKRDHPTCPLCGKPPYEILGAPTLILSCPNIECKLAGIRFTESEWQKLAGA